jgi:excisionase family DNA binding protein
VQISDFFYTESGAADALGVRRQTIWRWIKAGRFNIQRIGAVVFIPKNEVELVKKEVKRNVRL